MTENNGMVVRIVGVVIDVSFPSGDLPSIHNALIIKRDEQADLIAEVQEHIDTYTVRAIAMASTDGLRRGLTVLDSGSPIRVPVGRATLGRIFNVLGDELTGESGPPLEVAFINCLNPCRIDWTKHTCMVELK